MAALRDRLYRALGYPTGSSAAIPATHHQTSLSHHQTNQRRTSTPHAYGQPQVSSTLLSDNVLEWIKQVLLNGEGSVNVAGIMF